MKKKKKKKERLCWRILPFLPGEHVGLLAYFDHSAMIKYPNKKKKGGRRGGGKNGRIKAFDNAAYKYLQPIPRGHLSRSLANNLIPRWDSRGGGSLRK